MASRPYDDREAAIGHSSASSKASTLIPAVGGSLVQLFKENLEAVDGHCAIVSGETEVIKALTTIIARLQKTRLKARSLALSDNPVLDRLIREVDLEVDELCIAPSTADVFHIDVGITTAQAGIAETGTLVLDSTQERNRVVSLVPPVHIAILESEKIYETLAQTLEAFHPEGAEVSQAITFVTGPSRTADIELILAIGVHGPQELYVIVNNGPAIL
jgi:L-lactate dehydrogenase complex protein LldG